MRLIFIHGRSQQGSNPVELRQTWIDTWHQGLAAAGLAPPNGWDIRFPFYGNLLDQLVRDEGTPTGAVPRGTSEPGGLDSGMLAFETEVLTEIAAKTGADPNRHFAGQPLERGVANWEWVQALLRSLDERAPGIGSWTLERYTRDVYYYLTRPQIRRMINDIVLAELSELSGPCVVVGHSLGSVVGYNVLHAAQADVAVARYVTVGSPLGVHAVRDRLENPLKMPKCVRDWYNAMDDRDVVALRALTSTVFNITPPIRNKTNVDNHTANRHGIVGYLNDPDVARAVREA